MQSGLWALCAVIIPLAGAFLLPLAGILSARLRNFLALALVVASLAASIALVPGALEGRSASFLVAGPLGLSFHLEADALAVFMALVSSLVGAIIILFSFDYISHYQNQNEYYLMAVLFLGAMMGLIFSANLIFLYVFWEITGIASWRLIGFYRGKTDVLRADKAFLVTAFGALVMLLGILAVYGQTGILRPERHEGNSPSLGHFRAPPGRDALQVGHPPLPHVAAGRGRGALSRDGAPARRGAGQDRRLRLCAALPGHVRP